MSFLRQSVAATPAYVPGEQPKDSSRIVKLNTNENPYPPSPRCAEAIRAELAGEGERLRLYSDPVALRLRQAAATLNGLSVENVLHGNGSDELLVMLLRACVETGESVAFPVPTYSLYAALALAHGARVETHPFAAGYSLPPALFQTRSKLVFIASPNAPTGNSHPTEALARLAEALPESLIVVDEAYADFADTNALELVHTVPNLVVMRTLSKSYSLAGMRLGLLFGSAELIAGIGKVKDSYNLDRLAIVAGAAALEDQSWMRENVEKVRAARQRLSAGVVALGLQPLPSDANFVFVRCGSAARAERAFRALKDRGVLVRYFSQPDLADGLRITVGTDDQVERLLFELAAHLQSA
jgi:histidinol-phosphate aminotransferase